MGLSFFIIAICLAFGLVAAVSAYRPTLSRDIGAGLKRVETLKQFSPRNTLFIIGPGANHAACRMQRRLLKPAIAALIREDVTVMEVYGDETPRRNGEPIDWLDPSLLRHAMDAEDGFYVIYVNQSGKTLFRSEAPMLTADILSRSRLNINAPSRTTAKTSVLNKLRAA